MKTKALFILALTIGCTYQLQAQNLLEELNRVNKDSVYDISATFKATRLSIGHSVETRKKNVLEISAMTRYWNTQRETSNSFVADKMSARFGLDYGISDRLTFGLGLSTQGIVWDGFLKYRLVKQQNKGNIASITLLQTATHRDLDDISNNIYSGTSGSFSFSDKLAFTTQLLIARKFSRNFSLQIAPTYIHRNTSIFQGDRDQYAVGFGGRYKVGRHVSVVSEYYYVLNPVDSPDTYGPFSLGVNWELSDLMLQFKMTNNGAFVEDTFITRTQNNFNFRDGNFYFGFHATYFIQL
ncbi:DUF5777 family beta-barrel protein [Winogradskyella sp.]|uniref:DUF5777 family beta-barrel protein n=1 Tax=Winogradskyella sp. TaxID=1883156 RepID=UPI00261D093D|nr:DUF5777 family beta-barrel protein [Winogradskyella sp.]